MKNFSCTTMMWTNPRGEVFTMDARPVVELMHEGRMVNTAEIKEEFQDFLDNSVLHFTDSDQAEGEASRERFKKFYKALTALRDMVNTIEILNPSNK